MYGSRECSILWFLVGLQQYILGVNSAESDFAVLVFNINNFAVASPDMPFGGVKDSGYGREHGEVGIKEFVNVKSITIVN